MEEYITIALPKGKLFKRSLDLLGKVGYGAEGVSENSRKLVRRTCTNCWIWALGNAV